MFRRRQAYDPALGVQGADYPLWRAKEAIAHAERRLASESSTLVAHEARATALLGWLSAQTLALVAILVGHHSIVWILAAVGFVLPAAFSARYLTRVFAAKNWTVAGHDPSWILSDWAQPCELTTLESMASSYAKGIAQNEEILIATIRQLRRGWLWFMITPLITAGVAFTALVAKAVS